MWAQTLCPLWKWYVWTQRSFCRCCSLAFTPTWLTADEVSPKDKKNKTEKEDIYTSCWFTLLLLMLPYSQRRCSCAFACFGGDPEPTAAHAHQAQDPPTAVSSAKDSCADWASTFTPRSRLRRTCTLFRHLHTHQLAGAVAVRAPSDCQDRSRSLDLCPPHPPFSPVCLNVQVYVAVKRSDGCGIKAVLMDFFFRALSSCCTCLFVSHTVRGRGHTGLDVQHGS